MMKKIISAFFIFILYIVLFPNLVMADSVECTVTFDSQSGTSVESKTVLYNTVVAIPEDPTREGYIFEGWFKEANCINKWYFETDNVKDNISLYAAWKVEGEPFFGAGTEASPYLIQDVQDLVWFAHLVNTGNSSYLDKHFRQTEDIDLSGIENWTPIGEGSLITETSSFGGIFDGNGKSIKNLKINITNSGQSYFGLFGNCGGTIKNIHLKQSNIAVSVSDAGLIIYTGGIAGFLSGGTISNCEFSGTIITAVVSARSTDYSGGIAGYVNQGSINQCYNAGKIKSSYAAGGIAGELLSDGNINDCYNTGSVYGENAGGIAAYVVTNSSINTSYNTGSIGGDMAGGLAEGVNDFYSEITDSICMDNSVYAVADDLTTIDMKRTEAQMRDQNTFANFDFLNIWKLDDTNGYPYPMLRNNEQTEIPPINSVEFAGGRGTPFSPYLVETKEQLNTIRNYPSGFFKIANDIEFSEEDYTAGRDYYNSGSFWQPIGNKTAPFYGSLDGNGKKIKGLKTNAGTDPAGLLGYTAGGIIKNLDIKDCDFKVNSGSASAYAGGIAGFCGSAIMNCHVSGNITANTPTSNNDYDSFAGGIAGYDKGLIELCGFMGNAYASGYHTYAGGIAGYVDEYLIIKKCYANGTVRAKGESDDAGGIAAKIERYSVISDCYNTAAVSSYAGDVGGIAAYSFAQIVNCYNIGNLTSVFISSNHNIGGIIGDNRGNISNCFFIDTIQNGIGRGNIAEIAKSPEVDFRSEDTFVAFDMQNIWEIDNTSGYPYVQLIDNPYSDAAENKTDFSGGKGTLYSPYIIQTKAQLNKMSKYLYAHFILADDIVFTSEDFISDGPFYNNGALWEPLGTYEDPFYGVLDGNKKTVSGLKINTTSDARIGLFGIINGGTVKRLNLDQCDFHLQCGSAIGYAGGITGYIDGYGKISDCITSGIITASNSYKVDGVFAGGIAGYAFDANIRNCMNDCSVSAANTLGSAAAGGIIGNAYENTSIENCCNNGVVDANGINYIFSGGIVGSIYHDGEIKNCYNTGDISAQGTTDINDGGIAGKNGALVKNCYNIGSIKAQGSAAVYKGGVAGNVSYPGTNQNSYFIDTIDKGVGSGEETGTSRKTADEMSDQAIFSGFDFSKIWAMGISPYYTYPELQAQNEFCTVTFDFNGFSGMESKIQNMFSGDQILKPSDPIQPGYEFKGWHKEKECTHAWDFSSDTVTDNIKLYAKWTKNAYTITFYDNGITMSSKEVYFDTAVGPLPVAARPGYSFIGWYADLNDLTSEYSAENVYKLTTDLSLHAKFTVNSYTVTLNRQDGSAVSKTSTAYNTLIAEPAKPSRTGYLFGGWYKETACQNPWDFALDKVAKDTVLYAKWTIIPQYDIQTSVNNAAYGSVKGAGKYYATTQAVVTAIPKTGYRFVRWLEGSTGVSNTYLYSFTVAKNRALKAEFAAIAKPALSAVVSAGYNSIKLGWKTLTGVQGYAVYRSTSSGGSYACIATSQTGSYTDSKGLTAGKKYYYKVKAYCKAGSVTTYSDYSSYKYAIPVPAVPAGLKATALVKSIHISWNKVDGANGYEIYYSKSKTSGFKLLKSISSTAYTQTGLTSGSTYYYKVRAYRTISGKKIYGDYCGVFSGKAK
jgi:uncharacterized repeat protein (TIGR02543 family)